jgi:hypothetical protein
MNLNASDVELLEVLGTKPAENQILAGDKPVESLRDMD